MQLLHTYLRLVISARPESRKYRVFQ